LGSLPVRQYAVTDSLQAVGAPPAPLHVVSLAPLIAEAVRCLHEERSLGHLRGHA
jgi:hypothetical protein